MKPGAGRRYFIRTLTERFPKIAARIDITSRNILHCEMGYLAAATQEALDRGDEMTVRCYFAYAEELMEKAGPELANALQVSYLEYISFDKDYPNKIRPRAPLPQHLRQSLSDLEVHLGKL